MKLSIKDFQRGKTSSPYTANGAFWKSANLDIHGQEGIARINYKPTSVTTIDGTSISALPISLAEYNGSLYLGELGKSVKRLLPFTNLDELGFAANNANYVEIWKGHILSSLTTTIKALPLANLVTSWATVSSDLDNITSHQMMVSLKDPKKVYIPNGNKVALLEELAGKTFDPTDGATFKVTKDDLTIDSKYVVESIEEMGRYLVIFAWSGGTTAEKNRTHIFIWDRETATTIEDVLTIGEPKMIKTLSHDGIIYITGGTDGNIYTLSESGLKHYAQINIGDIDNQNKLGIMSSSYNIKTMTFWKNKLMVAVNNVTPFGLTPTGIYSVKDGRVNQEFLSTNGDGSAYLEIGSINVVRDYLIWGWRATSTYGLEYVRDDSNRLDAYGCYFETPLLRAGSKLQKNSIDRIEAILARPLQTGEGVRLKYRKNINDSWTTLATKDFATDGAQSSLVFPSIPGIENIQLKCEMTTGATSKNTPYLQELILF